MDVFHHWLEVTYPAEKDALRAGGFKPLLGKKVVERYLPKIEASEVVDEEAKTFAKLYAGLGARKKLGNVLVDDTKPTEADWEKRRYTVLDGLVGEGKEAGQDQWKLSELWEDDREASGEHLRLIAWAWSPVPEKKLP